MRSPTFLFHGLGLAAALVAVVACSSTSSSTTPGDGGVGTSAEDISRCKTSCDKMKFFKCSSAEEQARCYKDCDTADKSQIEVFVGCAENSICDPQCRTSIQPKDNPKTGGGVAPAACATACDKLVTCSLIPVGAKGECSQYCAEKGYQYQIDCVNQTACDKLKSTCGIVDDDKQEVDAGNTRVADCQRECDAISFFQCISAEAQASCRNKCGTAAAGTTDNFVACSRSTKPDCDRSKACVDAFLK